MSDEKIELNPDKSAKAASALVVEEQPESSAQEARGEGNSRAAGVPSDGAETASAKEAAAGSERMSRAEFDQLKTERDQLVDRLARMQAEFENARKRTERERQEFREYSTGSVVEHFLPVLDNFGLALKSTASAEQLRSGVELIVKQMDEILRQLQVTPVPTVGEHFDPHLHEALGSVERADLPDQSIAEEVRRGYRLRERLLRPALVRVVSNPKQKSE
jgi:molecular chaperone GrpE